MLERQRGGAQVLDTREPAEFAAAHLAGSQNIGLGGQYATWAGSILDPQRPIVIIAEAGREQESAMRLGRIGFDRVAGFLADVHSLESRPELRASTERLSPAVAAERLTSGAPPQVVDVRTPSEYSSKHIDGALSLPLSRLAEQGPRAARRPSAARPLRRRLPIVDRRQPAAAGRVPRGQRAGRRHRRLGSGRPAGDDGHVARPKRFQRAFHDHGTSLGSWGQGARR